MSAIFMEPVLRPCDPRSGFDAATRTFLSLRPPEPLPSPSQPLSFASYVASLLPSPLPSNPAVVDASTGSALSFSELFSQVRSLAAALRSQAGLAKGHVAFVVAPTCPEIPPLYLALLSLGAVVSPANPASTPSEFRRLADLCRPRVAFATSSTASKLPPHVATILLDSPQFRSFLSGGRGNAAAAGDEDEEIRQSDVAAIQYSSGTTGRVKAVAISHRNFISMVASFHASRDVEARPRRQGGPVVRVLGAPLFHSMGFFFLLKGVALGETTVVMGGGGVRGILRAAEMYQATHMSASPPVVVAMVRWEERLELRALEHVICGGAALHEAAARQFTARFPDVVLSLGYGATESGGIARMLGQEECRNWRSVGRLGHNTEAKIVDVVTGELLSVGQAGELWVRSPSVMTGYVGDDEANAGVFDSDGWLRTGDLCYFDGDGFLYIVDRLKELIKYKAYQVAPAELEHLLLSLPGVAEAAVVPYPDEEVGQIPVAFIVREPGSNLSEAEVIDCIAKQVAPYKKIRKVVFTNSMPKTGSGKISKLELRNRAIFSSASKL